MHFSFQVSVSVIIFQASNWGMFDFNGDSSNGCQNIM